jgi:hypothetical protein
MKYRPRARTFEALQWAPLNEESVANMQKFIGINYFNHGGILRLPNGGEVLDGEYVERTGATTFRIHSKREFEARYEPAE